MNVLILTGKFGMGHWSASQSLQQQIEEAYPHANVNIVDFLDFAMPHLADTVYHSFRLLVTHGSHIFNAYYKLTALGTPNTRPLFEGLFLDKLAELLYDQHPDVIIATHPLCAQIASRLREVEGLNIPQITCITDITAHPEWINGGTDCYLVPSKTVQEHLVTRGVEKEKICITGIPVGQSFRNMSRTSGGDEKRILIMGGGLGLLPKKMKFYRDLNEIPNVHITVITGKNEKLKEQLEGKFAHIEVLGFTHNMSDYMAKADLIVTKPGGITLFETIFAELPILVWPPQLEQERNNARWITQIGIGWVADDMDCAKDIATLILDDDKLKKAAMRMAEQKKQLEVESIRYLMSAVMENKEVYR